MIKHTGMALVRLMEEDGVEIPSSEEPIRRMPCFRTDHQQESPRWLHVFNGAVCGFSGDAYTYLGAVRGIRSPRITQNETPPCHHEPHPPLGISMFGTLRPAKNKKSKN